MSEIKLVISDVDGTLLTSKRELTEAAKAAVADLKKAGIDFAVTSGRPPRGMLQLLKELDLNTPVAAFNGGMFFDPVHLSDVKADIKVISEKLIPEDVSRQVIEKLEKAGHDVWIYRGQDWFVRKVDAPHVEKEKNTVNFSPTLVPDFDGLYDRIVKIVGVNDQTAKLDEMQKILSHEFGGRASAALSQPYYLDITHPQANKGEFIRFLSQRLAVTSDQIATLGDMPNDIFMFQVSGLSIAMGNSNEIVKSAAVEVTDSYDDEGFAHAIEKLLGKRAS